MKKVILGLAIATMILSCKETKVETVKEEITTESVEAVPDTVVTKTETTVDTIAK